MILKYLRQSVIHGLFLLVSLASFQLGTAQNDKKKKDPALDLYFSANGLYNRRLYELAVDEYRKFLSKYSTHGKANDARLGLALSLFSSNRRLEAEPEFRKLSTNSQLAKLAPVHNYWGHCLLEQKKYAEAEKAFVWSVKNRPELSVKADALAGLSESQYRQKKWAELGKTALKLRQVSPKSPHLFRVGYQGALGLFESKDFDGALQLLKPLSGQLDKNPLAQHITYLLAECNREKKDYPAAVTAYAIAANKLEGPYTEEASYRLGYVQFLQEKYAEAVRHLASFKKSYNTSKLLPQATLYLGRCYYESSDHKKARKEFAEITGNADVGPEATLWLGRSYLEDNAFKDAEQALNASMSRLTNSPLYPDLLFDLGTAQLELQKYKDAAGVFQKSYIADADGPNAANSQWLHAYALHRGGDYSASGQVCSQFLAKFKSHENAGSAAFIKAENFFLQTPPVLASAIEDYTNFIKTYKSHEQIPVATFRLGQAHYQKKDFPKSLEVLKPLLSSRQSNPALAQLLFIAGDSAFQTDQWDSAVQHFGKFLQEQANAENVDVATFKRGLAYIKKQDSTNASSILTAFVQKYKKSVHYPHALVELGLLYYQGEKYPQAVQNLNQVPATSEHYPHALYYLGYSSLKQNNPDSAATFFQKLSSKHPEHELAADATLQQGKILLDKEEYSKAVAPLQKFINAHVNHAKTDQAAFHLGIAFARQQQWAQAVPHFLTVYQKYSNSSFSDRALYELAWCEKGQDRNPQASAHYQAFLQKFPQSPLVHDVTFELAELEFQEGKYASSIQRLNAILPKVENADLKERVLYRLGWNHYNNESLLEAARNFEIMLAINSKSERSVLAAYQAGAARLELKEHAAASQHFYKVVSQGSKGDTLHEQASIRLGETQGLSNKWPDSQRTYQTFLQQYPNSKFALQARFGIGWAYENQRQFPQAIQAYQQVLDLGGKDETTARCQLQVGQCYFSQKKYAEAIPQLLKVRVNFKYDDLSALALLDMGKSLEATDKRDQARETYEELIRDFSETKPATVAKQLLNKIAQN